MSWVVFQSLEEVARHCSVTPYYGLVGAARGCGGSAVEFMFALESKGPRTCFGKTLTAVLVMFGLVTVSVVSFPSGVSGAATDPVTNCSGSASVAGSLPYEVSHAGWGDTITFALAPTCSVITIARSMVVNESLTIQGPGAELLAVSGGGTSQLVNISSGPYTVAISGLTIASGNGKDFGGFPGNGGAIANQASLTVTDDAFVGSTTYSYGGAIANEGTLTVQSSSFVGNSSVASSSGYGAGAIYNDGTASIANSTLAGNSATDYGGAVLNFGTIDISNSTIASNTATNGGGVFTGGVDQVTLAGSVVAGNAAPFGGNCYGFGAGTLIDNGYNLDDGNSCQLSASGDLSDTPAGLDPAGPQSNGGQTATVALQPGSAAIHAVTDSSYCPGNDQRGVARTTPCDMGAFDSAEGPYITALVSGSATYGGTPNLAALYHPPTGVTVTGSVSCSTVDGGNPIAATTSVGVHIVDGSSCSGLVSSEPIIYQGVADGYVVSPDSTTTTLSMSSSTQTLGNESATVFTVAVQTGNGEPLPSVDSTTVTVGSTSCVAAVAPTATGGSGGCSIGDSALPAGYGYIAYTTYPGDADLAPSSTAYTSTGFNVLEPPVTLIQGPPTSDTVVAGTAYSGQLTASNEPSGGGALTWTTTSGPSPVTVASDGVVSSPSNTAANTYALSGNVSDPLGDAGTWSFTLTVSPKSTTTSLQSLVDPSLPNAPATYTATVTPLGGGAPVGTTTFSDGGVPVPQCESVPVISGRSQCTVRYTVLGHHQILANYSGSRNFLSSTSNPLGQTVSQCGSNLVGCNLADANLQGANLTDKDLDGANLEGATLSQANLSGANLARATLTSTNLEKADLKGAKLTSASAEGADLKGAKLTSASAEGADLKGAKLTSASAEGADLKGAKLTSASAEGADLKGAKLTSASAEGADLTSAKLTSASAEGADLTSAKLTSASAERADLTSAKLTSASAEKADLTSAKLTSASAEKADLTSAKLTSASAEKADLTSAKLTSASAEKADLTSAKLTSVGAEKADLKGAKLTSASAEKADLTSAKLTSVGAEKADLTSAKLTSASAEGADLKGAKLTSAGAEKADLTSAKLTSASAEGADLTSAKLTSASAEGADLNSAKLTSAGAEKADLTSAKLTSVSAEKADLTSAKLTSASAEGADLKGAKLTSASAEGADLTGAKLTSASAEGADLKAPS